MNIDKRQSARIKLYYEYFARIARRDAYTQPGDLYLPKLRLLRQLIRPANSGGEPANAAGRGWGGRRPLAGARGSSARHAVQRDRLEAEAVAG